MMRITRRYQLGGRSVFRVRTRSGLLRQIATDVADLRRDGDLQGLGYEMSRTDALALGAYEVAGGGWWLPVDGAYPLAITVTS